VFVKGSRGMRMDQVSPDSASRPTSPPGGDDAGAADRRLRRAALSRSPPPGIDLPTPIGTPVHAFAAGEVVSALRAG
jgi:murein DD-endopeptidase MepM/ murein hydrolase activator NlpD